jgi:hypothetical protein
MKVCPAPVRVLPSLPISLEIVDWRRIWVPVVKGLDFHAIIKN